MKNKQFNFIYTSLYCSPPEVVLKINSDWLITFWITFVCLLLHCNFIALLENTLFIWRLYVTITAEGLQVLDVRPWAGRVVYRATPAGTWVSDLWFLLKDRPNLVREGYWGPLLTRIHREPFWYWPSYATILYMVEHVI